MNIYKIEKEIIEKYTHTCTYASAHTYRIDRDSIDTRERREDGYFPRKDDAKLTKIGKGKNFFPSGKKNGFDSSFIKTENLTSPVRDEVTMQHSNSN